MVGHEPKLMPSWISILAAAGLFAVALILSIILANHRRLLAEGRPAPAIVTRISNSPEHGKKIVHYVFLNMGNTLIDGKSSPQSRPPAVGSVLNIIYEPDRENCSSIYPVSLVRIKK